LNSFDVSVEGEPGAAAEEVSDVEGTAGGGVSFPGTRPCAERDNAAAIGSTTAEVVDGADAGGVAAEGPEGFASFADAAVASEEGTPFPPGKAGQSGAAGNALGAGLGACVRVPPGSSEMILRMEAKISSIVGSDAIAFVMPNLGFPQQSPRPRTPNIQSPRA